MKRGRQIILKLHYIFVCGGVKYFLCPIKIRLGIKFTNFKFCELNQLYKKYMMKLISILVYKHSDSVIIVL